jgi:hypothetical protein
MHIIEQRDFLVLTNGEGSPRQHMFIKALIAFPIFGLILAAPVSAAMHGWMWGWLSLLSVPAALAAFWYAWARRYHATLEIDRREGRVRLERRFANKTLEERLTVGDIAALEIEATRHRDRRAAFAAVLALRNGRRICLGPRRRDRAAFDRAKEALRASL